ncbi:hypothetical protein [Winogradskyella algicola]|uniref:hypothetical protein n=1 Tax=Winogradskyella algicola TaxID=2575815 RepID=UPI001109B722|nr:hypothetical protein [Winogradskyella algicola]
MIITSCGKCENYDTEIIDDIFSPNSTFISTNDILEFDLITEETVVAQLFKFDLRLIHSAYAFGCDDTYNPIKWINNIVVTSNQDFSSEYLSGTPLNELISVNYFNGSDMTSVTTDLNNYITYINQIGDGGKSNFDFEKFSLITRPEINQQLSFSFEFTFTDGSNYILETETITW